MQASPQKNLSSQTKVGMMANSVNKFMSHLLMLNDLLLRGKKKHILACLSGGLNYTSVFSRLSLLSSALGPEVTSRF